MRYILCLSAVLILSLTGCNALAPDLAPDQRWQRAGLKNYDYEVERSCYCMPEYIRPMRVSVRGGAVRSAVYLDDSAAVRREVVKSLRTMDEWFAYIQKGRERPFFRLDVTYHEQRGYPTYLHADVHERMADDEQTVRIGNLVPK